VRVALTAPDDTVVRELEMPWVPPTNSRVVFDAEEIWVVLPWSVEFEVAGDGTVSAIVYVQRKP
jgi:hypothetical protein